ncbi:hypothetical protein FRC10_008184 [Ceratobasidium sp. 414]|nr:hypothetical protein FRC10_008184 [Ceratobasidium sp. 414]
MSHESVSEVSYIASDRINSSLAADRVAQSSTQFAKWAGSVKFEIPDLIEEQGPQAHLLTLPDTLQNLVRYSKTIPSWVHDPEAEQYAYARRSFPCESIVLPRAVRAWFEDNTDPGLSEELECSLLPILGVTAHNTRLQHHEITRPNEADRRIALDNLTSYLWNYQSGTEFIHRAECPVQLPSFADPLAELARPDSAVFFQTDHSLLSGISDESQRACASIPPRLDVLWYYVLHWVIEYKGLDTSPIVSMRQAWMGIVSGLYQRRSLGFKDQYVFGTAHYSNRILTIFAGTWIDSPDPLEGQGSSTATEKIVIHTLATLNMAAGADVLQYYLLMRATRRLALDYKQLIEDGATGRVLDIMEFHPDIHSWPPLPKKKSSTGSGKRRKLALIAEEQGNPGGNVPQTNVATSLVTDDCVQQMVDLVGVDNPFIHRFAEELSENGEWAKVRG